MSDAPSSPFSLPGENGGRPATPPPPPPPAPPNPTASAAPAPASYPPAATPTGVQNPQADYALGSYYAPGWEATSAPKSPLDGVSAASIPAGLLLGPVGVGLGVAGLSRTKEKHTRGRSLAISGIAIGTVVTLAWGVGAWAGWNREAQTKPLTADVTSTQTAHSRQLVLGNCLAELPANGDVAKVKVVPCKEEHRAQVVARTEFDDDASWPGQDAANGQVARICVSDVLSKNAPADLELVVWAPSKGSWSDGDRVGLCLAGSTSALPDNLLD